MDLFVVPTMGFDLLSAGYITNTSESKFSVHTTENVVRFDLLMERPRRWPR
jgi:hypothetical protein